MHALCAQGSISMDSVLTFHHIAAEAVLSSLAEFLSSVRTTVTDASRPGCGAGRVMNRTLALPVMRKESLLVKSFPRVIAAASHHLALDQLGRPALSCDVSLRVAPLHVPTAPACSDRCAAVRPVSSD